MNIAANDPQGLAEAVGRRMMSRDTAAQSFGIVLDAIAPGLARMHMVVRPEWVNGHDICHGGMIFTLADTAFAYACNSYNSNAVAHTAQITFVAAAKAGETLTAEARQVSATRRTGVYDVSVTAGDGRVVALLRGNSYRIKGEVVRDLSETP
ncbi:MAG TPA: hydroxyphenylacetyl-CoA thioesterase PaaI [Candidatus Cybelea sp.]|nr:hydroxyphenylacetyl-CoA thioesterase PaaI [Candidatus Cybelea sp.]